MNVTRQPWKEVGATIGGGVPGSKAVRAGAASAGGQSPLLGVRAVICHPEPVGAFRKVWTWPKDAVMAIESGQAALYATEHATKASLRRAQRRWETSVPYPHLTMPTIFRVVTSAHSRLLNTIYRTNLG